MYKWSVQSAVGRRRPLTNDFLKVADGIAASLRQFSVSVSRAAEEGEENSLRITRTRSARTREAVGEVSSLAQSRPRTGIDARSLAARPPQGLNITKVMVGSLEEGSGGSFRSGSNFPRRGPGRGAARGRGDGRGRGRGKTRGKGKVARETQRQDEEDEIEEEPEYTKEEKKLQNLIHGGFPTPYEPTTTLESLATPVFASPRGQIENVKYKMQVATSNTGGVHKLGGEHLARMARGEGTFFESTEAKEITERFNNQVRQERAELFGWGYEPVALRTLPEKEREVLAKAWAAGHYALPKVPVLDDVIGLVQSYTRRNETWLPADEKKFEEKLRSLLPAQLHNGSGKPLPKTV